MPLSAVRVLELNDKYHLVEGLCKRERENPEGAGLDLRVGAVYTIEGDGFLGISERYSPKKSKLVDIAENGDCCVIMKPQDYFLVSTMETVCSPAEKVLYDENLPARYLMPLVYPRSSLQRCGVSFHATKTDPGYTGKLTFGIKNLGKHDFKFELGARMFNIVFEPVIGEIERAYSGQHQGGRVSGDGKIEVQN